MFSYNYHFDLVKVSTNRITDDFMKRAFIYEFSNVWGHLICDSRVV